MAELKDSGNRREFGTGAVRDISEGKGRCDLLPLFEIGSFLLDATLQEIGLFMKEGKSVHICEALRSFINKNYSGDYETAILELAIHYEDGAKKYADRNWEKGILCHCFVDSGVRHYLKWKRGDVDEPHDRAFLWNMFGLLWTLHNHPELNDLPFNRKKEV